MPRALVDKLINEYNQKNNSGLQNAFENKNLRHYKYDSKKIDLLPSVVLGSQRDRDNNIIISKTLKNDVNTLVVGATGGGKTQGFVLNQLIHGGKNSSAIIGDAKGELAEATFNFSKAVFGSEHVSVINFRDPYRTHVYWNPFEKIAARYAAADALPPSEKNKERSLALADLQTKVESFFPSLSKTQEDWSLGARSFLSAVFSGLVEDCSADFVIMKKSILRKPLKPKDVTFKKAIEIINYFSFTSDSDMDKGFFTSRLLSSPARQNAAVVLESTSMNTRTGYTGIINTMLTPFRNPRVQEITKGNTVDIEKMAQTPQRLYVIYDLQDASMKPIVNDFFLDCLQTFVWEYNRKGPLSTPVNILIDEFSSLKTNPVYVDIIAQGRGMGLNMNIIVQSLSQLKSAYEQNYRTIVENCSQIFLGNPNADTAREIVDEFGTSLQLDKNELLAGRSTLVERPRLTEEYVMFGLKKGECLVKIKGELPMKSKYLFFYETPEYHLFKKFDLSTIKPKIEIEEEEVIEEKADEVTEEERKIQKAREALERRRQEILKRMQEQKEYEEEDEDED